MDASLFLVADVSFQGSIEPDRGSVFDAVRDSFLATVHADRDAIERACFDPRLEGLGAKPKRSDGRVVDSWPFIVAGNDSATRPNLNTRF